MSTILCKISSYHLNTQAGSAQRLELQLPSSRAWGDAPVVSLAEYAARVPRDPAQRQIVPVPARPFPETLRDPDLLPPVPPPSALAERLWRALVLALVALAAILLLA